MSIRQVRPFLIAMGACALVVGASPAVAQVTSLRDLSFGTIMTGTTTSVTPTSANAAQWRIQGILTLSGGIEFTLPTVLTRSGGSETMPISFCSACAIYRVNNTNPSGGTTFNPSSGTGLVVSLLSSIYIWLGASVSPPLNQKAGTYTGTVVMTVTGLL